MPLLWQSNGGYGAPLAIYIPLLSIVTFGNTDFAVRLPSAILGSLTIIFIGLLVNELTKNKKLALVTAFLLAISPWHFSASRIALESNYALFFIVSGLYLFFLGLNKNKLWATIISFIAFGLSMYSYYTEWVLTPLIIFALLVLYHKTVLKKKIYYAAVFLFGILLIPLLFSYIQNLSSSRASSEFITKDIGVGRLLSEHSNPIVKGQIIVKAIANNYSAYMSWDYLFFYGARLLPKENPYQFGFFLGLFLPGFVWGLYKLKGYYKEHTNFIYLLLVISPLAAAVTEGEINNWRSLPQLLPVTLITASGTLYLWETVKNKLWVKIVILGLLVISFMYFFLIYFRHFPLQKAVGYQYGYKQIALYIKDHYTEFDKIVVDRRFGDKNYYYIGVPSSYIPFYTYLDPVKVQNPTIFPNGVAFDKYEFRDINWSAEKIKKNYLYVVPYDIVPNPEYNLTQVYEVYLPNKQQAFKLYTVKESTCPPGFILFSNFCVMKYDAKCTNTNPKCVTKEGVYNNSLPGCACQNTFKVVSTPGGAPITFIPEDDGTNVSAKAFCSNAGWHLITNDEWMTIAQDVASVPANWCNKDGTGCGNPPGSLGKILANGHNDSSLNKALEAGPDSDPTFGTLPNPQKRTLTLSNGQIIWDFAGNVWQWIDITIARKDEPRTIVPGFGNLRWTWGEFQTVPQNNSYSPPDPNWNSTNGIGRIYHFNSTDDTDTTLYTFIRAGNWRHGNDSGAFTVHMQPVRNKKGIDDIGFRCATNPI